MKKISNPLLNYENKWVALTTDRKKVLAAGDTIPELEKRVKGMSSKEFVFTWVPPFDVRLVPQNVAQ